MPCNTQSSPGHNGQGCFLIKTPNPIWAILAPKATGLIPPQHRRPHRPHCHCGKGSVNFYFTELVLSDKSLYLHKCRWMHHSGLGQASQPVCRALICATTVYRKAKCTTPQAAMVRQSCKHGL